MTRAPSQRPADGFKPGDIVECVDDSPLRNNTGIKGNHGLVRGALYTVETFVPAGTVLPFYAPTDWDAVTLYERPFHYAGLNLFGASRFRHIYRPDPKLVELLTTTPVVIDEPEGEVVF